MQNGKIVQVMGPVVDVEFPPCEITEIYTALRTTNPTIDDRDDNLVIEVALRRGAPMGYVCRQGLFDPITRQSRPPPEEGTLRYVMVVGGDTELPEDYTEVPESSILSIDRSLEVSVSPLA